MSPQPATHCSTLQNTLQNTLQHALQHTETDPVVVTVNKVVTVIIYMLHRRQCCCTTHLHFVLIILRIRMLFMIQLHDLFRDSFHIHPFHIHPFHEMQCVRQQCDRTHFLTHSCTHARTHALTEYFHYSPLHFILTTFYIRIAVFIGILQQRVCTANSSFPKKIKIKKIKKGKKIGKRSVKYVRVCTRCCRRFHRCRL